MSFTGLGWQKVIQYQDCTTWSREVVDFNFCISFGGIESASVVSPTPFFGGCLFTRPEHRQVCVCVCVCVCEL